MARAKVLIVDDDPITLEVLREWLERAGYDVLAREEALGTSQIIAKVKPDVVLLDLMMPALPGEELAVLLRKNNLTKNTKVILHSGKPLHEIMALVETTGAIGAIEKGSDESVFVSQFERLLRSRS
jgi:CheY-like chemotaxis protein